MGWTTIIGRTAASDVVNVEACVRASALGHDLVDLVVSSNVMDSLTSNWVP